MWYLLFVGLYNIIKYSLLLPYYVVKVFVDFIRAAAGK